MDDRSGRESIHGRRLAEGLKLRARLRIPSAFDVRGVTKLHGNIYVLTCRPNRILVYSDRNTFALEEEAKTDAMCDPQDMVGCHMSNCLYVSDAGNVCVWRVTRSDHQLTRWLADYSWILKAMSDGNVMIARWGQPFSFEIYRPDAVLVRRLPLPTNVEIPKHVVETSNGHLVLSHWDRSRMAWGISELNSDGQVVRSYDPKTQTQHLDDPCYLAIDWDNRIYVADCHNRNRVILLNSKLSWDELLLTEDTNELLFPRFLYFDKEKKQMLVVHGYRKKVVDIFSVDTEHERGLNGYYVRYY